MDFTVELPAFLSVIHRNIYLAARRLTPLERSLAGVQDEALQASCAAYHGFVLDMLSDMYENPHAYGLPAGELEALLQGKKVNALRLTNPEQTKALQWATGDSLVIYLQLLCLMGQLGTCVEPGLLLSAAEMETVVKQVTAVHSAVSAQSALTALERVGLVWDGVRLVSQRHPGMFAGMCALARSAQKLSGFGFFAFCNCEFRNIIKPYKPVFEDYIQPLYEESKHAAEKIRAAALALDLKPIVSSVFWKLYYKHKSEAVLTLDMENQWLSVHVTGVYGHHDLSWMEEKLAAESPAFQQYILRHLQRCVACTATHLGRHITLLGKRQRVCGGGGIAFIWREPGEEDMAAIMKCIAFRKAIIDVHVIPWKKAEKQAKALEQTRAYSRPS